MNWASVICVAIVFALSSACGAFAGAVNFQEPADWALGDLGSTYQKWEASIIAPFLPINSPPTSNQVNPATSSNSTMSVHSPGFGASSGGYYSFDDDYLISANVFNHGGTAGSGGPYSSNVGTRVIVQTAATTNPDFALSVLTDSIELVTLAGDAISGGANKDLLSTTELFRDEVATPFGPAEQQELAFEFLLPGYTSDFQLQFLTSIHSSFYELRVDTFLVESSNSPGDFDVDGEVDGDDLGDWQAHYGIDAGADADQDGDSDGADFLAWQRNYTGSNLPMVFAVPEPATAGLTICSLMIFNLFTRPKR